MKVFMRWGESALGEFFFLDLGPCMRAEVVQKRGQSPIKRSKGHCTPTRRLNIPILSHNKIS